jgi:AcrR family transcriptional regulator
MDTSIMSRKLLNRVSVVDRLPKDKETSLGNDVRGKILKTAIRLFAQNGFRGTTTKEIALAAGVNEVTIFRNFASKQELYAAILEHKSNELVVKNWVTELEPFAERGDDYGLFLFVAREILTHYQRDPDFLCLKLYSSLEGHELAKQYRERQICPLFKFLRRYIIKRQGEGVFINYHPDIAVQSFLGSVYNHVISSHFHEVDFIKLTVEETAKAFVEIFLSGMRNSVSAKRRPKSIS